MSHEPGITLKPLVKLGRDPGACWTWLGKINELGTAIKQFNGKAIPARRWMWEQLFGPIGAGIVITTRCNDKACINPFHLRACTQAEANQASVQTLLLPHDVVDIRRARKDKGPNTARVLAEKYSVSPQTIRDIWARRSWAKKRIRRKAKSNVA